jgi:PAS domain S-box-containing protein
MTNRWHPATVGGLFWSSAILSVARLGCPLLLALPTSAPAQTPTIGLDPRKPISQYVHDVWQIDQGLPQNSVFTMVQPRDGYLWLGSEAGLTRFDGVTFTTYNSSNAPELTDTYVSTLMVDRAGVVWAGTWVGGVVRVIGGKPVVVPGASGSMVLSLHEDQSGGVWAGRDDGLLRLRNGQFSPVPGLEWSVYSMDEADDGTLLFGTERGLYALREGRLIRWQPEGGRIQEPVWTIYKDRNEALWFGTPDALYRATPGRLDRFTTTDGLPAGGVSALIETRNGQLWIGTDGGGLARFVDGQFQRFAAADGLSDDRVNALLEDHEGSLWVGTQHGGLNRFREPILAIYSERQGLSANVVWSVYGDRQQALWIGTQNGLNRLQSGRFTKYTARDGLPGNAVYATLETFDSTLWAATDRGLARRRHGRWESLATAGSFPRGRLSALLEDKTGALWMGGNGGLYRWKDGRLHDYTGEAGVASVRIRTVAEDQDGNVWVGTHGRGLIRFREGLFTTFTIKDGLSNDVVESLYADEHGLWVGTVAGLDLVRGGRITAVPLGTSVLMTDLFQILKDDLGNLWLSANQGLASASQQELLDAADGRRGPVELRAIVPLDGDRRIEFNGASQNAGWKSPDGRLWFPSIKGLVVVDPARLRNNPVPPPVHVEELLVDGRPVDLSRPGAEPPGRGRLELHYTATSLLIPERVRFRYRLEGYDEDWVDAGPRRVAYYTHVPGGHYRFHVTAANNDGVWNETGAVLAFRLGRPFYETWWFYGLCGLAVAAAVVGVFHLRVRQVQQRAKDLAVLVEERTSELKREVEERRDAEERYRHLFDANPQPVWVSDRDTLAFLAVNDSAARHYGYTREEFFAMRLTDLQPPDLGVALTEWIRATGDGWRGTSMWHHRKKDGTTIEVEVAAHALNFAGRPAVLIVATDVTERQDLEARLRQAQKMEAVGQLAGGIAHDLNNVLTAVMAHVDLAVSTLSPDAPVLADLTQAQAAAHRGATMIRKLLGFSRRERLMLKPLRLEQIVGELAPTLRRILPEQIEITLTQGKDLPPVAADPGAVQQILFNLATNARDAMPDGGQLRLHVGLATPADQLMAAQAWGTPGHYVVLSVTDNGTGMAPQTVARIFEPYFSTKSAEQGTGLGMAMVYGLMKQHLGYVLVNSEPGVGTEVRLYFPVSQEPVELDVAAVPQLPQNEVPQAPQRKGQTILVVEDQESVRSATTRALARYGYRVLSAADGEEGLQVWRANSDTIDLVISDAIMPRMSGLALREAVRRQQPGARFLLTSGYTGEEVNQSAQVAIETPFLSKPWTVSELLAAVREVLGPA